MSGDFCLSHKPRKLLDPYVRMKLFSSAKYNQKKYTEDKESILEYYNSKGYRDAVIVSDTLYYNKKKQLDIDIKVDEGHKYYFGNISVGKEIQNIPIRC